jgi:hypothetical protein
MVFIPLHTIHNNKIFELMQFALETMFLFSMSNLTSMN